MITDYDVINLSIKRRKMAALESKRGNKSLSFCKKKNEIMVKLNVSRVNSNKFMEIYENYDSRHIRLRILEIRIFCSAEPRGG